MSSYTTPTPLGAALLDSFFRGYLSEVNARIDQKRAIINDLLSRDEIHTEVISAAADALKKLVEQRNIGNAVVTDRLYVHDSYRLTMLIGEMLCNDIEHVDMSTYANGASSVPRANTDEADDSKSAFRSAVIEFVNELASASSPKTPIPGSDRIDNIVDELQQIYVETFGEPDDLDVRDRVRTMVLDTHSHIVKAALR